MVHNRRQLTPNKSVQIWVNCCPESAYWIKQRPKTPQKRKKPTAKELAKFRVRTISLLGVKEVVSKKIDISKDTNNKK